ncbi:MAG: hypothetical protein IJI45_19820 [Anaerolineaceae bacterium]|nr:hypothetical protein [Anaerolineaceae bacterium]
MPKNNDKEVSSRESIFLNEHFMAVECGIIAAAGLISLLFFRDGMDSYGFFALLAKLVTAVAMYFAFRSYKWDMAKGLMGGVLFSLMFDEFYQVFVTLWGNENFDQYITVGIPGSLFLSAACMSFLMTVLITINHFILNYASEGNPKNLILNRIAILFKLGAYALFLGTSVSIEFTSAARWVNVLRCLMGIVIIVLLVSVESQFDSFKVIRQELLGKELKKERQMTAKGRLLGIWLISMNLLALFTYVIYIVSRMFGGILRPWYLQVILGLQCLVLIFYMLGSDHLKSGPFKLLYRVLIASSLLVIPVFLFVYLGLYSQYHAPIPDAIDASAMPVEEILPKDHTVTYKTDSLYIIFPEYSSIELVLKDAPSKSDESITWCSGAAAHHVTTLGFSDDNIEGDHAVKGTFYDSPHDWDNFTAFTFANGKYAFDFDDPVKAVKDAAAAGGSGFMHFGLFRDGEVLMHFTRPRGRCYRTLAELNGHLCIIDSVNMVHFNDFVDEVQKLGVENALYMDMGSGWNYSWLRDASGKVLELFGLPVPWSHNWIIFRK